MKKTLTLLALLACALSAAAQDTLQPQCSRYMVQEAFFTNVRCRASTFFYENGGGGYIFFGQVFNVMTPTRVYGVAVLTNDPHGRSVDPDLQVFPMTVKVAQKEGGVWRVVDSAVWRGTGPERYFRCTVHPCDSTLPDSHHVSPVYEVYFDRPVTVTDSFAVGTGDFGVGSRAYSNILEVCSIQDSLPGIRLLCVNHDSLFREEPNSYGGISGFAFPILMPPDTDSYVCAGVDSVRVRGSGTGWVNVAWAPGSEDQDLFEIAYGVRGEDPERYASVTNLASPKVIFDDAIDTGVYFSARVRARCHHRCVVHDTLVWGPWSDMVHFYVGNHEPNIGIAEADGAAAFALSPNPTAGEVTVTLPPLGEGSVLTVADASGREVHRTTLDPAPAGSRLRLDLNGLPAGAYFVTLVTPQGSHTEKLLIQ